MHNDGGGQSGAPSNGTRSAGRNGSGASATWEVDVTIQSIEVMTSPGMTRTIGIIGDYDVKKIEAIGVDRTEWLRVTYADGSVVDFNADWTITVRYEKPASKRVAKRVAVQTEKSDD